MMKLISKSIFVAATTLMLSACVTQRIADFTLASTKNVNFSSGKLVLGARVKGEDKTTFGVVYMKNAVDRAIETDRCAVALSDVVISVESGFGIKYIAEGTQVLDRSLPGCGVK
ncbi:hypothetical protein L5B97_03480 [Avibacterium sp. 20-15]|uniref:hypothetical protein n=1 Tax=unclassified Avibacterium TaxID=2685287 RepID=UPI002026E793|nr:MULTISPECIES: hypothetical protein [unclassified Avibacterium]MCW9732558.1 hypothetical protein [Avibacterium sp. 20-15]URL04712.1 hypothetical protein L4F93_02175 [Avibacterium sp. 20-132]